MFSKLVNALAPDYYAKELCDAITRRSSSAVADLLDAGVDPNTYDPIFNCHVLSYAAEHGYLDHVKTLLEHGANPNIQDYKNDGTTPLIHIVRARRTSVSYGEIIKMLVDFDADINAVDYSGCTAVMYTVFCNRPDLLKIFIECGANVNLRNNYGLTALLYAFPVRFRGQKPNPKIIEILLAANADYNVSDSGGRTVLMHAVMIKDTAVVGKLLQAGAGAAVDVKDNNGQTALMHAIERGLFEIAKQLVQAGANVDVLDANGQNALMMSIVKYHYDIAAFILDTGTVELEVQDTRGMTVLMLACIEDCSEIVKQLISAGVSLNATDADGNTALMYAAQCDNYCFWYLLQAGADTEIKNADGKTAADILPRTDINRFILDLLEENKRLELAVYYQPGSQAYAECKESFDKMRNS